MESQKFDQIEAYLSGEMNETDAAAFDQSVANDPVLAAAVDRHLIAHDAIEVMIEENLRAEMKEWSTQKKEDSDGAKIRQIGSANSGGRVRRLFYSLAAAASVAILVGVFGLQFSKNNYSNEALAEGAYYFDLPTTRSTNTNENPLSSGFNAYEAANFTEAISFFQGITTDNPQYKEAQFYLGHSFYQKGEFEQAIVAFQSVIDANDLQRKEAAEWYQIVNYIAAKKQDGNFTTLLNQLVTDEGHAYHKNAVDLNGKLNSFWRRLQ